MTSTHVTSTAKSHRCHQAAERTQRTLVTAVLCTMCHQTAHAHASAFSRSICLEDTYKTLFILGCQHPQFLQSKFHNSVRGNIKLAHLRNNIPCMRTNHPTMQWLPEIELPTVSLNVEDVSTPTTLIN